MSRLSDLLAKATSEKATAREVDELSALTGKRLPQQIFDVMQTSDGLVNAIWILQKRENPNITKEEISSMITMDNDVDIGYEMLYCFTRLTREQIAVIRGAAEKAPDPNRRLFTTEDYKEFHSLVSDVNKFMKANEHCKFSAVIVCEFVPIESAEKNDQKAETQS